MGHSPKKGAFFMSIHDEIGEVAGGQIHLWDSERRDAIIDNFKFDPARSKLTLDRDLEDLPQETIAAEIARNIYKGKALEFGTSTFHITKTLSRIIVEKAFEKSDTKKLIDYLITGLDTIPDIVPLAWLSRAFDAGATQADLLEWGVEPFVVIQLIWWQSKPEETRLEQQVRAVRNGWGLPLLATATRANYGNLSRMINKGDAPQEFLDEHAKDLKEVDEVLDFFRDETRDLNKAEPPVEELTEELKLAWAKAFEEAGIRTISPDSKGRWVMYAAQGLKNGQLREPLNTVARYFDLKGFKPEDWTTKLTEDWFVRVQDK